jgi:hypothetical protein
MMLRLLSLCLLIQQQAFAQVLDRHYFGGIATLLYPKPLAK